MPILFVRDSASIYETCFFEELTTECPHQRLAIFACLAAAAQDNIISTILIWFSVGNFYAITNESDMSDARIFFAQGCEIQAGAIDESTMA